MRLDNLKTFLDTYPSMINYYIGNPNNRALDMKHFKNPDTKFCTMLVMVLILIFTALSVFLRRDLND